MLLKRIAASLLMVVPAALAQNELRFTQPEVPLWTAAELGNAAEAASEKWNPSNDGFHRITNVHKPSMFVFLPPKDKATGAAVVVCPGGGHRYLVMDLEGSLVAEKLNAMGIAAFVLKSRLAHAEGSNYKIEVHSLQDAQRAIRIVRSRASEWNVDPERVGIMGFSAGGHIAALAETRYADSIANSTNPLDRISARPDFAVLAYPGIHNETFDITKDTPPTFLVVAHDDSFAEAVAAYYAKLKAAGVPAEAHIYSKGGHGFGMTGRTPEFRNWSVSGWPDRFLEWMREQNLLRRR
jgi:acetyl esterase/lipase